jgi:hypothetical protein
MQLISPSWSRPLYGLVIALLFQIPASSFAFFAAHAGEDLQSVYPGRYIAHCKPAQTGECVCVADSTPHRVQNTVEAADPKARIDDPEYLRMLEWLRLTCDAVAEPGSLR